MWADNGFIFDLYNFFEPVMTIQNLFFLEKEYISKKSELKCKKRLLSIPRKKIIYTGAGIGYEKIYNFNRQGK